MSDRLCKKKSVSDFVTENSKQPAHFKYEVTVTNLSSSQFIIDAQTLCIDNTLCHRVTFCSGFRIFRTKKIWEQRVAVVTSENCMVITA